MNKHNTIEDNEIYYIKIIDIFKRYWYLFALSLIICLGCAMFINFYEQPVYQIKTTILIKDNTKDNVDPTKEFLKSFAMFSSAYNFQNELLLLQSSSLIYNAVKKIGLELTYYQKLGIKKAELYKDSPFKVEFDPGHVQPVETKFQIIPINDNQFRILVKEETDIFLYDYEKNGIVSNIKQININRTYKYGDTIKDNHYKFRVLADIDRLKKFNPKTKFYFYFNNLNWLVYYFQSILKVEQVNTEVTAADIKIKLTNPRKGIDFINALTEAYLQQNLDRKNFIAENTIQYINNQLSSIQDSLSLTEQSLQNFRSSHQVMDISSKSNRIFDLARDLENQKAELQARAKYYEYIDDYLSKNREVSDLMVPSAMGVNNDVLTKITQDLLSLDAEKNSLLKNKQDKSPYFNTLTIRIDNLKNALAENIKYSINTNKLSINGVEERLRKLYGEINELPGTERQLFGIERKFKLNDNTYTFLLEKQAEAQIAKASNLPDNEIIEPASLKPAGPVSPNKKMNLIISILAGLFLPICFFWIKDSMDETVTDEKTLKLISDLPRIGNVYYNSSQYQKTLLIDEPLSQVSESLRTVRTNLDYFLQGKRKQVILFTSAVIGEGKSFISLNIAISLALLERKTILLDFDFRKPKLFEYLGVDDSLGATSYLINKATFDDVIVSTGIKYLDFIPAGPIPPNPLELIGAEKTEQLLNQLKKEYDYIIIDSPPCGLVSDAFLLMRYADLKIFVVRQSVTPKRQFAALLEEFDSKHINNLCLLLNGIPSRDNYYGRYGYYSKKN